MAKADSKSEQNQLIADPQHELDKIAALLSVEPQQAAEAVSALLECNAVFDVHCNNLINSNPKLKHDGRGNWRMLLAQEAWQSFQAGVTPLLTNGQEEIKEQQTPDVNQA